MNQSSWLEDQISTASSSHDDFTFTDSHCHLDFPEFSTILERLIQACQQQRINRLIVPSVSPENWNKVLDLCSKQSQQAYTIENNRSNSNKSKSVQLLPALGIHPWYLQKLTDQALDQLSDVVTLNKKHIVAIGETGIDGTIAEQQDNLKMQQYFFEYQLSLAQQHQLPIIIHHRKSHPLLAKILKTQLLPHGGIIHGFSGSYQQAKSYLDAGLLLGIGGTVTYDRAKKTINTVKKLPLSSLVLETDAPSMPLQGRQGQPNSPLMAKVVFDALCSLRHEEPREIALQLENNIDRLLGY